MRYVPNRYVTLIALLSIMGAVCAACAQAAEVGPEKVNRSLLSVGQISKHPISIRIRTTKSADATPGPGSLMVVHVEVSRRASLAVVYQSLDSHPMVIFPNATSPDSWLEPGKEYALFDSASCVQLGMNTAARDPRLTFYVSSVPFTLEPKKISTGEAVVKVPIFPPKDIALLTEKLEAMSHGEGFNRKTLTIEDGAAPFVRIDVMALPRGIRSKKPGTVTGSQGIKSDIKKLKKE